MCVYIFVYMRVSVGAPSKFLDIPFLSKSVAKGPTCLLSPLHAMQVLETHV